MKKLLRKLNIKRKTAGFLAVILSVMAFLPYIPENIISLADYAQDIEPASFPSWDASRYQEEANWKVYAPTGLMYENKVFHLGSPVKEGNFPAGAKQYLVENKQHSKGEYKEFDKTFIYCVDGHTENAMIHLGSQAFLEGYWSLNNLPKQFPKTEAAKDPIRRKFNFLMNVYASYMGRNDSIQACNDANAGTAKYIVASVINWVAADECGFTGTDLKADLNTFQGSKNYLSVVKQMNPNAVGDRSVYNQLTSTQIPGDYKAKGCSNWADWMFAMVWDAATITKGLESDAEETVYYAKMDHATETYSITIPYPSDAVKAYYQKFSAKDLYGDWVYSGPTDGGLVFTSQSGEVPADGNGVGTLYWANPNQEGLELAKDIGSAQLATFKFYTQIPREYKYAFDISQTYFAAKLDKELEIHVRAGSLPGKVKRYRHKEGFGTNYNVGLNVFDSETGKSLADTHWDILEKFDDSQLDDSDLDLTDSGSYSSNLGSLTGASWEEDQGGDEARISTNYSGDMGLNDSDSNRFNQANASGSQFDRWSDPENDPCNADEHITDSEGVLHYVDSQGKIHSKIAHKDARSYTYEKGYCSGHPAPVIEYEDIPELEYDEETGDPTNEDQIEAVKEYNQQLHDEAWAKWLDGVKECEQLVEQGGFFHAIDPSGQTQKEALERDRDQFYQDYISLTYEYSAKELIPAPGYSLHGSHPDDIPLEWRTVSSSEFKDSQSHGGYRLNSASGTEMEQNSIQADHSNQPIEANALEEPMFVTHGSKDKLIRFGTLESTNETKAVEIKEAAPEPIEEAAIETKPEETKETTPELTEEATNETKPEEIKETTPEPTEKATNETKPEETKETAPEPTEEATNETKPEETKETPPEPTEKATAETKPETVRETEEEKNPEETGESTAETKSNANKETEAEPIKETLTEMKTVPIEKATLSELGKIQKATKSQIQKVNGGITWTGLFHQVSVRFQMAAKKMTSFFQLKKEKKRSFGGRSSLSGLPESTQTSRIDPLDSSISDWTFIAYDHRTEGEIHFNKKDMDLKKGEKDTYHAYGDAQGDGTLEGAVYGLFASTDIPHPDGHSGVLFRKDNLVSVAVTDRNGDGSFLAITQAPGNTYNYKTGTIEVTPDGWKDSAPINLYTAMHQAVLKESDAERFEGHTDQGNRISLIDSRRETASGYEKLSSNQGRDGTGTSSHFYPIENNEALNGNSWIGRPLIVNADGTQYYMKELTRSEGYELSIYGKDAAVSNKDAFQAGGNPSAEGSVTADSLEVDRLKKSNTFFIKSSGVTNGYRIYAKGIPEGASFYKTKSQIVEDPNKTHTEYRSREENALAVEAGARVIINGSSVEANEGDTIPLPNGETATITKVSEPEYDYTAVRPDNALRYTIPTFEDKKDTEDLMEDANAALKKASFKEPDEGAPWMLIPIEGETFEEQAKSLYEGMEKSGLSVFNCLRVEEITDGKAVIRFSYRVGNSISYGVYDEGSKILYLKKDIDYNINGAELPGYLYVPYTPDQFADSTENSNGFVTYAKVRFGELSKTKAAYPEDLSAITVTENPERTYWVYSEGEPIRNNDGSIKTIMVQEEIQISPGYELKDVDTPVTAVYDGKGYTIEVGGENETTSTDYKITYTDDLVEGTYITPEEYAGEYGNISVTPNMAGAGTYIKAVTLRYDKNQLYSDGGTRQTKVSVEERPIVQKIKITKDIFTKEDGTYEDNTYGETGHEDKVTENGGGKEHNARYLKNFRFKTYLKSNLERLYRAEDGTVKWQDRNGNEVDISAYRADFPEKVQKLYTRVAYQTNPLSKDSNKAAISNTELYNYTNGLINPDQNLGYTAILEKTKQKIKDKAGNEREVSRNNYDKFFDSIKVANQDKWDRTEDKSTSFQPFATIKKLLFGINGKEKQYPAVHNNEEIENSINTTDTAKENAIRSDRVRQFAITWYLDDEVAKLVKDNPAGEKESATGSETYSDEIYDKALSEAIKKAENYLKPFFSYDLDEIYSINWDSETDGGKDKDNTTLSADLEDTGAGYCYGISEYLPYGTYVTVEQQPFNKDLGDFFNKHYKTDAPKEIELPSVYEGGKTGSDQTPEGLSSYYHYNAADNVSQLSSKYHIRFNEEWPGESGEDLRKYVIKAHNYLGDYEIYQYGLDLNKLSGSSSGDPSGKGHFTITQGENDPGKDYYNTMVDSEEAGGNKGSHYLADDGNAGKQTANGSTYETDGIEKIYRYGSVSEDKQTNNNVSFPSGDGEVYRDNVTVMEGMQTAYEGKYASMLVPWSVAEPADEMADTRQNSDGSSSYKGYGYRKFTNTFYKSRLRIEKLDSETGENILHDGALFALYAASREDGTNTDGLVTFYEADTKIKGSKEFLEAMGAEKINNSGETWTGTVPAGTPICKEEEQVILADPEGRRTGQFEAITTTRDGVQAREEDLTRTSYQDQNTGYLVTPQPLGAGTYVLCEIKPPAGYVRTKPVAIEIYSDQTTYYLDGNRDSRVAAAIYEDKNQAGTKVEDTARIYIGNTPVRLEVSKIKDSDHTVTYKTDTRLEGTELELKQKYGTENLEFAYKNGTYLGYAWYKGTMEYLQSRKDAGEDVNLIYVDGVFAGYGLIERTLDTDDDQNRYVAGAKMALYDAIAVTESGDSGDLKYHGVEVARDRNNNVQSVKVLKGYAGNTVEFLRKEDTEGSLTGETGNGTWTYKTIERGDTDILFYSLGGLKVTETETDGKIYGYDKDGNRVQVKNQESIYVLKAGQPFFELTGGDLLAVKYNSTDKGFNLSAGTTMYHLNSDGNRDAYVNPTTGMAFAKEGEKLLVWPVKISQRVNGAVIAREKIKTWRIAAINADTDQEYITGTYNGSNLVKSMNPVLNGHGLPEYYQRSGQTYKKGDPVYDIDGDFVRYKYDDLLTAFNNASYSINNQAGMEDIGKEENTTDDKKLYHRQGESWVMENTWISGEKYPNDPFQADMTVGQADMLKRVIPGTYIMEEVTAPSGYTKGFPEGITVNESREVQKTGMKDEKIKVEIAKTDAANQRTLKVISDYQDGLSVTEPKGAYSYSQVSGTHLALYKAKRVYTTNSEKYPKGYYLVKTETTPAKWTIESTADNAPVTVTADWITDGTPQYFEGIPAGDYILDEIEPAEGYISSSMELNIRETGEVQTINFKNDHTKLEIYKYYVDSKGTKVSLSNDHAAGLALYKAQTDSEGNILMENGKPMYDQTKRIDAWTTDDLTEYTDKTKISDNVIDRLKALIGLSENQSSFITDFEAAYKKSGKKLTSITWHTKDGERTASLTELIQTGNGEGITETWNTDTGKTIRITIYRNVTNGSLDLDGQLPLNFEYQFNYKENGGIKSYDTLEGMHRIDYLPLDTQKEGKKIGTYVLVEETVPVGYEAADPKAIVLTETGDVQRFSLENEEKYINVLKVVNDGTNEYAAKGAKLALYKADKDGNYVEDKSHLVETWISGSDGTYTKEDKFNDTILQGFSVGYLKPHRINKTPYGIYYIAELEAPAYMQKADPVKIKVGAEKVPFYKMVNSPFTGKLEIKKKASDTGDVLGNARFKITNRDTGEVFYMTTGTDGHAERNNLLVGKVQTDGTIKPYTYTVEEISPPDFYQISEGMKKFQFDGKGNGNELLYTCEIENSPTIIIFRKTNFDTGMAVEGAEIAVYHAVAVNGEYEKAGEVIATAISGSNGFTLTKKLSANQVYIMEELKAPDGYALSKPVIFTVNRAGTGIRNVSNDFNVIKLASDQGSIEAMTVTGRVPVKVWSILKDLDIGYELPAVIGTGENQTVTPEDGIKEGHLYEITEYTKYSDGRTKKSRKETKRIYLDQNGSYTIPSRTYLGTKQELTNGEGMVLASWTVNEDNHEYTILNPVTKEIPIAKVTSSAGANYKGVKKGTVIRYTISYTNPYHRSIDIKVKAMLIDGLEYLRSTDYGTEQNGIITWNLTDVGAQESGTVEVAAVVNGVEKTSTKAWFETETEKVKKQTILKNSIVPDGSITIINHLTGTGKDLKDSFIYQVKFMDQKGNTLIGYQAYTGSIEGQIKGVGEIPLTGDSFLTFAGLPYGTRYEITKVPKDGYEGDGETTVTGEIQKTLQSAVFINNRNDETIREILTAGGSYQLTETTKYSDQTQLTSGIYRFQINASGMVDNVDMEDKPEHLYFSKVDAETKVELAGGNYELIDVETETAVYKFTKEKGEKVTIPAERINPGTEYIMKEEHSPEGYAYEKEIRFTAEESGIPETIIMQDRKTEVEIKKIEEETGEVLTGGRFLIREKETKTVIKEFTPEGNPLVLKGILIAGKTYELIEKEPPAGYAFRPNVEFTVPLKPKPITVTMKDQKTWVEIRKLDHRRIIATPNEATKEGQLEGCILQILNEDKTPAKALRDDKGLKKGDFLIFTTRSQFEEFMGQLKAGKTYWLHEVKPQDGYAYAEDISFTVSLNGQRNIVVMIDDTTHVILSKKTITGNEELPGNHLSVTDREGNVVEEWISGEQPHAIIGKLIAGKTYLLCEDKPVHGYGLAEKVEFTVSLNGAIDVVEMFNEPTKVKIYKTDTYGHKLEGAILQVLDQQKNVVIPEFQSSKEGFHIIGSLAAGETYYLHETSAPSGYLLSADVPFTVPKNTMQLEVVMQDPKKRDPDPKHPTMRLFKVDAQTGNGIKGVEFTIFNERGELYKVVSTREDGQSVFPLPPDGTYTYQETKTASGYLATNQVCSFFIVNQMVTDKSQAIVVNYHSPRVDILKLDADQMIGLAGAKLEIRNKNNSIVYSGITDKNGLLSFYPDDSGTYTVEERRAPDGYIRNNNYITFHVSESGSVTGNLVIYNRKEGSPQIGVITAKYHSHLQAVGMIKNKGTGFWSFLSKIPKTGEKSKGAGFYLIIAFAFFLTVLLSKTFHRRRNEK
ncbi:SpaA isopeptide-forming pilin-related protein [Clostridium sp. E02]|uniref:SpaA isopeptide-forming pilin-related protein n=1 Tax=Clostridium sp. E02 TaxID=2487134 RepID=UPI000F532005|nr:SpaA isopeptide-forming pilin-related protein [Clostridium sp. E02]